jgi:hypothetical protein
MNVRDEVQAEKWIAAEIGAATSALVTLQARLTAAVTGKPAPKPAADRLPTILDELVALNDPTAVLAYVVLSQAQRATNGPVRATRVELATKIGRSTRTVTRGLRTLLNRKLVYRLGRSTYGVRTVPQ